MQKKLLKFQAVLFGSFNFPASPETTVKLMNIYAQFGFMPQVMNVPDPMTGMMMQRVGLINSSGYQIIFSPDRIDFTAMESPQSGEEFLEEVVTFVGKLEGGILMFNRVALVIDSLLEEISQAESEGLRNRFLPKSGVNSIEWIARWVTPVAKSGEQYNACFEVMNANGLMMLVNGNMKPLSGIKVMHDISTAPSNVAHRFNCGNLHESLSAILNIIAEQSNFYEIQ